MDCIINFTPTGMIPTKKMTPHVPIKIDEIVTQVLEAADIGITCVHLHARDEVTERSEYRSEVYGEIIAGIRKFKQDLVLCVSLSGREITEFEKRSDPLSLDGELKPDMGSLTLSSLNFNNQASLNEPDMIKALAQEMKKRGIVPELEAFDAGMINYAKYLVRVGLLEPPYYFNLILGNIACAQADLLHAGIMIRDLPDQSIWTMGGVGSYQLMMNSIAIATGGGVRVGLEDNYWYDTGRTKLARNIDMIKRIHVLAIANERNIMTPSEFRRIMKLQIGNGHYGRLPQGTAGN
jgi:3-keto-5-aminohexanoate cleavage enzyme